LANFNFLAPLLAAHEAAGTDHGPGNGLYTLDPHHWPTSSWNARQVNRSSRSGSSALRRPGVPRIAAVSAAVTLRRMTLKVVNGLPP
jgi:hypothetical protein